MPDSERDGAHGPAQPAAPQSSKPFAPMQNGRRSADEDAPGIADGLEGSDDGNADWQRAAHARGSRPPPASSSSESDDDEDEEEEEEGTQSLEVDHTDEQTAEAARKRSQQAGSVEASRAQNKATKPSASVAKQQQRKRAAPEPSGSVQTEPAVAARQRRKRRTVQASSSDEEEDAVEGAEDEPEPAPTQLQERQTPIASAADVDAADDGAVASSGRRRKRPETSANVRRHEQSALQSSSSEEEDDDDQPDEPEAVARRRPEQVVPATSSSSEEDEEIEGKQAGDSEDGGGGPPAPGPVINAKKHPPVPAQPVDSQPLGKKGAKRAATEPADNGRGKRGAKRSRKSAAASGLQSDNKQAGVDAASEAAPSAHDADHDQAATIGAAAPSAPKSSKPDNGAAVTPAEAPVPMSAEQIDEQPPTASLSKAERKAARRRLRESRGSLGVGDDAQDHAVGQDPAQSGLNQTGRGKKKAAKTTGADVSAAEHPAVQEDGGDAVSTPAMVRGLRPLALLMAFLFEPFALPFLCSMSQNSFS